MLAPAREPHGSGAQPCAPSCGRGRRPWPRCSPRTASDLWPPVIDRSSVAAGYEAALGAALGDDLTAAADEGAPRHWRDLPARIPCPAALARRRRAAVAACPGAARLARRLAQIGVVADEATGRALAGQSAPGPAPGQPRRRDVALGRLHASPPARRRAAAVRLSQRNRLAELTGELGQAEAAVAERRGGLCRGAASASARPRPRRSRAPGPAGAYRPSPRRARPLAAAQARAGQLDGRLSALIEAGARRPSRPGRERAGKCGGAPSERAHLPDLGQAASAAGELEDGCSPRSAAISIECRAADDRLRREAESRRPAPARPSTRSSSPGRARAEAARAPARQPGGAPPGHRGRRSSAWRAGRQRSPSSASPDRADREGGRRSAASRGRPPGRGREPRSTDADRALKAAEAELAGGAREPGPRRRRRRPGGRGQRSTLIERFRERLECAPEEALAIAELDPGEELPEREQIETRIQRLIRERENIGPVNLRAETEATELETQLTGLQNERADLVSAIARLRQGISSLNREGRERLLAAFEVVNEHFAELFTRLFGGGRAHLSLTEHEDPLEAGLEIMASPPGKRLQVMSLLSGGEQALTALALLFAVFLANPAPICVLDEVDAPLDDANVDRFCTLVEEIAQTTATRFLVITHHRMTMARMDRLFGVTMAERGVSQLVSVDLQQADRAAGDGVNPSRHFRLLS